MSEFFSLLSALGFAASHILIRRGLAQSNPVAGFCISITISAVTLWTLALLYVPLESFWTRAIWYFALGGLFASGLGRMFVYFGIDRVGVARSVPVASTSPMFASVLAVLMLGEPWSLQAFFGTALVIIGVVIISRTQVHRMEWRARDLIFPLMAALSFALSANVRKFGFLIANLPLMASTVNATTGLLLAGLMLGSQGGVSVLQMSRRIFGWLVAAGICNTLGMLFNFYALSTGNVVIVEPLISTNPAMSVILSAIFLRDVETVNLPIAIGVICTTLGTLLLIGSKA